MKKSRKTCCKKKWCKSFIWAPFSVAALLAGCGGSGGGSSDTGTISLGLSDAPIEDLSSVTITVDTITFNREGEDIVVDTFTSADLGITDADTFTLDLLEVQGNDNRIVIDALELPAGEYQNLRIDIVDEDINASYVDEVSSGLRKMIKVPSDELKLGGFTVEADGLQTFIVEFDLWLAMTYNPGPDRYILKPRGVRVIDVEAATVIEGTVDTTLFNGSAPCDTKVDPLAGNVVYLYSGHGLDTASLGDAFDPDVAQTNAIEGIVEPFAATMVSDEGDFIFAYLPAGDYTLAFSCDAGGDDPDIYDALSIPTPSTEWVEVTVAAEQTVSCSFPDHVCQ